MFRVLHKRNSRNNALSEHEGAHTEVHLLTLSATLMHIREELTMDTPYVSHFAKNRGKTGKSTARMQMKVNSNK